MRASGGYRQCRKTTKKMWRGDDGGGFNSPCSFSNRFNPKSPSLLFGFSLLVLIKVFLLQSAGKDNDCHSVNGKIVRIGT